MTRKQRKTITKELFTIIRNMLDSNKYTKLEIATTMGVSLKTVNNIAMKNDPNEEFVSASTKRSITCRRRNQTSTPVEQAIFNSVCVDNSLIQEEIRSRVLDVTGSDISQPTISRKLKKLKITRKRLTKVPNERNTQNHINERAIYAAEINAMPIETLVFLDETGLNLHSSRSYGYSHINQKAYTTVPANRFRNESIMCAININGVIAFETRSGSYNSESFGTFIIEKLVPYFNNHPNHILIMDNARIHKSVNILNLLRENNIACKFTVPYTPQLNPIEEFFSMMKARYYSIRTSTPNNSISQCIHAILSSENYSVQCMQFYNNMRSWLEKARQREPFI